MGISAFFFLEKLNRVTNKWEFWQPLISSTEVADLYPYDADYDLFDIIKDRCAFFPHMNGIRQEAGLYTTISEPVQKVFNEVWEDLKSIGCGDSMKAPYIFTYADIWIYCFSYPSGIKDDETIPNPMTRLKERIECFAEVMDQGFDAWKEQCSELRVVCWFD